MKGKSMKNVDLIIKKDCLISRWNEQNNSEDCPDFVLQAGADKYFRLQWPDHVNIPRFNRDADIYGPFDNQAEAIAYRDNEYTICPDCDSCPVAGKRFILTTGHAASSYGQPVLVDTETGQAYGKGDILPDGTPAIDYYEELAGQEDSD
jgi:hypothetical protein